MRIFYYVGVDLCFFLSLSVFDSSLIFYICGVYLSRDLGMRNGSRVQGIVGDCVSNEDGGLRVSGGNGRGKGGGLWG